MATSPTFSGGAAVERVGVCRVCKRTLKNPKWAALGIGPVCARKGGVVAGGARDAAAQRLEGIFAAKFRVRRVNQDIVWIEDIGTDCRSVTNDAEAVVTALAAEYGDRRIIYRDSMGRWDELCHAGATFTGFRSAQDLASRVPS